MHPASASPSPAPGRPSPGPLASAESPDEALLTAIRARDAEALGLLYDRYGRLAFGVAYRVLEERGAAEDVVQDAFLAVWQRAATYSAERGSVRAWLLTITRNAAVDRRRGRHAWSQHDTPLDDVAFRLASETDDAFAGAVAAVDAERVRAALDALPHEQRQVIELAYDGGLTHVEIAERTGVPLGTVKGRMRLGLQRLRVLLSPPAGPPASTRATTGDPGSIASTGRTGESPRPATDLRRRIFGFGSLRPAAVPAW